MATMQSRLADFITAVGTDYKQFRTWITGSNSGDLTGLNTTAKTSLLAAINEVNDSVAAGVADATETVKGKVELATNAEALGMAGTTQALVPSNLGAITNVANGLAKLNGASQVPLAQLSDASTTAKGIIEQATDAETLALADTSRAVTPGNIGAITNVANGLLKLDASGKVASAQLTATPDASTTVKGIAELATDAEALAMSSGIVAMTPANLAAITNVNNGLLKLDGSGFVPAARIPGSIDDVLEYANLAAFPGSGTAGKMYVAIDTGKVYRWSGTVYVEISASPGTTDAVPEGSTNLYYTQTRVDARITALVGDPDTNLVTLYTAAKA